MTTERDILATVDSVRERTRRAKRAGWIPLAVFGVLVLPATLFHLPDRAGDLSSATVDGGPGLAWYWRIAIPLGYVLVAGLMALRNARAGIRNPVRTYLIVGVVLIIAVFLLAGAAPTLGLSNFGLHGLEPTITIGLALFVLAWLERSTALGVCAAVVTAAAIVAAQYDVENLLPGGSPAWLSATANDLALALTLLICSAAVAVADRTRPLDAA